MTGTGVPKNKPSRKSLRVLHDENERLSALIDSIRDEVWFVDENADLILVNRAALDEFGPFFEGETPVENKLLGLEAYRSDGSVRPGEEMPPLRALRGEIIRAEEEIVRTPAKGELRHRQVSAAPVRNREEEIIGAVCVIRDITDLKRTENELYKSEQRYRALAETSPDAIIVHKQNEFLYANPAALNLYGADSFEQLRQRKVYDFLHPDHQETPSEILKHIEKGKPLPRKEARLIRMDGREVCIETYGTYIVYGDSKAVQVILRDITDRKRAERTLLEVNASLEQKVQERTVELARQATQLRALAGEITLAERRERRRLASILHDHLQQLLVAAKYRIAALGKGLGHPGHEATREIEHLLNDCIDASRSLTAELSPPILHEAGLNEGLEWLAKRLASSQGIRVELQMEETGPLPEDLKLLLFESIRELLFNVVKHAQTRSAVVILHRTDECLRATVSDQGVGFDPAELPPVGEPGGGFGFFRVRQRLELFGGNLKVDSAPGQGCRIMLSVPVTTAENSESTAVSMPSERFDTMQETAPFSEKKIRIMLADDHRVVRQGIANLISDQPDFEIVGQAGDGRETVDLAAVLQPDVILMDVSMPEINGIEATRMIHRDFPHIRIIGLSMYEESERSQALLEAGAVNYITKSGPAEELIAAIRAAVLEKSILCSSDNSNC